MNKDIVSHGMICDAVEGSPAVGWVHRFNHMRGVIWYLGLSVCMVADSTVAHYLSNKVSVMQISFARGIGLAAFTIVAARHRGLAVFRTQILAMHICRGLLTVVSFWAIFYALGHLLLADAAAINYSRAAFMTICGVVWFRERVSFWRWLAVGISYLGALVVICPTFGNWNPVYLVALAGAALNAAAMTGSKHLLQIDGQLTNMAYSSLLTLVFSLPAVLEPLPFDQPALLVLCVTGALGMLCSQLAVLNADMSLLAPYDYVRLPCVVLIGVFVFGEIPGLSTFAGAALILMSGVLLWMYETRNRRRAVAPV